MVEMAADNIVLDLRSSGVRYQVGYVKVTEVH